MPNPPVTFARLVRSVLALRPVPIACAVLASPRPLFFLFSLLCFAVYLFSLFARARSFFLLGPLLSLLRRVVESGNG